MEFLKRTANYEETHADFKEEFKIDELKSFVQVDTYYEFLKNPISSSITMY